MIRFSLVLALASCAWAQNAWQSLSSENPADATLRLHVAQPHRFHVGELIPIDVRLRDPRMGSERTYWLIGVLLDPPSWCGGTHNPCEIQNPMFAGTLPGLGKSSESIHSELNLYVPPLAPGKYRVAILAGYYARMSGTPAKEAYVGPYNATSKKVISDIEKFEIIPATAEWTNQSVAAAAAILKAAPVKGDELRRTRAARQLRYLQTQRAWQASLDLLAKAPDELLTGLTETDNKPAVCRLMLTRLKAPQQYVTTSYLEDLDEVCDEPPLPAPARPGDLVIRQHPLSWTDVARRTWPHTEARNGTP